MIVFFVPLCIFAVRLRIATGTENLSLWRKKLWSVTDFGVMWTWFWMFWFNKMRGISWLWRMPSCRMLCHVALVRTDVSEECSASIIRVTRIGELGTLAVTTNRRMRLSYKTSALTRATQRNIPEEGILHSHSCESLKSYIISWILECYNSIPFWL
jgi:hypothetical protein